MSQKKPVFLTLSVKANILDDLSKGVSLTFLAKKHGVAKSTICAIRSKKQKILKVLSNTYTVPKRRKTLKSSELPRMERALYKWFLAQRARNTPVSGEILKEKAKFLHSEIKENSGGFNASDGWLQRFKTRHGIRFLKICGEKLSSQPELVDPFKLQLKMKMEELSLTQEQVYNADETGLYWKLLPGKTFVSMQEKTAPGRKSEKQRITFLACTNGTGSHKLRPLVIGKAKNPRSFKNFTCPLDYQNSKTAWMTAPIFKHWFHHSFVPQVKAVLSSRGLPIRAILVLDNAPSPPPANELISEDGGIFTMFMPTNVTSILQPMDQNIIRLTKTFYKNSLLATIVANGLDIGESIKKLTIKDAVLNLAAAWNRLDSDMIFKCWKNLFHLPENEDVDDDDDIPLSILRERMRQDVTVPLAETLELLQAIDPQAQYQNFEVEEWINAEVLEPENEENDDDSDTSDPELVHDSSVRISPQDAISSLNTIIQWAEESLFNWNEISALKMLREKAILQKIAKKEKQTLVTDFF